MIGKVNYKNERMINYSIGNENNDQFIFFFFFSLNVKTIKRI